LGNEYSGISLDGSTLLRKLSLQFDNDQYHIAAVICDPNDPNSVVLAVGTANGPNYQDIIASSEITYIKDIQRDHFGDFVRNPNSDAISFRVKEFNTYGDFIGYVYHDLIPSNQWGIFGQGLSYEYIEEVICSIDLTDDGSGSFFIDEPNHPNTVSGSYGLYYLPSGADCSPVEISCIRFCDDGESTSKFDNVIASSFQTYDDNWNYDESLYASNATELDYLESMNVYEKGEKGKWRPKSTYAYQTDRGLLKEYDQSGMTFTDYKNFNSGTYTLEMFNWDSEEHGEQWKEVSKVLAFSPNGNALEEENIIGIRSAAKFGYHQTVPYVIGQNTDYASLLFESFENEYNDALKFEDGLNIPAAMADLDESFAHTGRNSLKLNNGVNVLPLMQIQQNDQIFKEGALVEFWTHSTIDNRELLGPAFNITVSDQNGNTVFNNITGTKVAQSGEWLLIEAEIPAIQNNSGIESIDIGLQYNFQFGEEVWIDDLRIQPLNASSIAYVYDPTDFKLIASFDDQHFALLYQYNEEGQLIRTQKETERGTKTLQESYYNTPETDRNQ